MAPLDCGVRPRKPRSTILTRSCKLDIAAFFCSHRDLRRIARAPRLSWSAPAPQLARVALTARVVAAHPPASGRRAASSRPRERRVRVPTIAARAHRAVDGRRRIVPRIRWYARAQAHDGRGRSRAHSCALRCGLRARVVAASVARIAFEARERRERGPPRRAAIDASRPGVGVRLYIEGDARNGTLERAVAANLALPLHLPLPQLAGDCLCAAHLFLCVLRPRCRAGRDPRRGRAQRAHCPRARIHYALPLGRGTHQRRQGGGRELAGAQRGLGHRIPPHRSASRERARGTHGQTRPDQTPPGPLRRRGRPAPLPATATKAARKGSGAPSTPTATPPVPARRTSAEGPSTTTTTTTTAARRSRALCGGPPRARACDLTSPRCRTLGAHTSPSNRTCRASRLRNRHLLFKNKNSYKPSNRTLRFFSARARARMSGFSFRSPYINPT